MSAQSPHFAERIQSRNRTLVKRTAFSIYRMGCARCDVSGLVFFLPVRDRQEFEGFEACVKEAVWIINRFDPVRLQRIQRDLSNGIVVVPSTSGAHYLRYWRLHPELEAPARGAMTVPRVSPRSAQRPADILTSAEV